MFLQKLFEEKVNWVTTWEGTKRIDTLYLTSIFRTKYGNGIYWAKPSLYGIIFPWSKVISSDGQVQYYKVFRLCFGHLRIQLGFEHSGMVITRESSG